jgi:integrase
VLFRGAITKTRRDVWVPLTPWALDILRQRKDLNRKNGFGVDQLDWIFPSKTGEGAVVEVRKVQQLLLDQSGLWIGPHDLRRTLAADIFGDTKNVHSVGMALGHAASEQNVSAGYVPISERLRTMRPLYEARERRLKQLIGIEKKSAALSQKQKAIFEAAELMLRNAGISLDDAARRWGD